MKIALIIGTRPEIIKMSPIIRECQGQCLDYFILHTGQHYSYEMDRIFFDELNLPHPKYNLNIGSGSHAEETGQMLMGIEKVLLAEKPDVVLVLGDTNTTLAGALAAAKLHIKLGHVEAGVRSYDRNMPEEINRILVDHISDYLFPPTNHGREILLNEGIADRNIFTTGSTVVEAVSQNLETTLRETHKEPESSSYFLVTCHRQENVDVPEQLGAIFKGLSLVYQEFQLPLIYPLHPRTKKSIKSFGLDTPAGVKFIKPVGYLECLRLEKNARLILTDSGGVLMEACVLHVPCVTLRNSIELVETVEIGANVLAGCEPGNILQAVKQMLEKSNQWPNLLGDGTAARQTLEIITGQCP
ncbi:non-hydrolyzing UDP-N-acetylglucosamine 2-epimerase [Chloroflexota bacterium]